MQRLLHSGTFRRQSSKNFFSYKFSFSKKKLDSNKSFFFKSIFVYVFLKYIFFYVKFFSQKNVFQTKNLTKNCLKKVFSLKNVFQTVKVQLIHACKLYSNKQSPRNQCFARIQLKMITSLIGLKPKFISGT